MITQIISVLKLQKLTRVGPIFKNTSEWEKFQSSFGTLKAQYDFFFHITIEASDFFFSPYSSRYVFLYGTHGESCQYGLCSLPICNPPQPQISHPTLLLRTPRCIGVGYVTFKFQYLILASSLINQSKI